MGKIGILDRQRLGVRISGFDRRYAPFASARIDIGSAIAEKRNIERRGYDKTAQTGDQFFSKVMTERSKIAAKMSARYGLEFGK